MTVIVLFGGSSDDPDVLGYEVPPQASGLTLYEGAGDLSWAGRVRVVDTDCKVLWEGRIDAGTGAALVAPDGTATWVPSRPPDLETDPSAATPPGIKITPRCSGPGG